MRGCRSRLVACLALVAAGVFGCAESPGPMEPPRDGAEEQSREWAISSLGLRHAIATDEEVPVIERRTALRADEVVQATIGPAGGGIKLKDAGLKLSFPAGALAEATTVTVIARKGKGLIYEFYPSPLSFAAPVKVEQDLKNTTAHKDYTELNQLKAAYFPGDGAAEFNDDGTVRVTELLPVDVDFNHSKVKFFVHHFSGYLVASGRKDWM